MTAPIVPLRVNVTRSVAEYLRQDAQQRGISVTELIRRIVALWQLVRMEQDKGNKIVVMENRRWWREEAITREIIVP